MTTLAALGACTDFVAHLEEGRLLTPEDLRKIGVYMKAFPHKHPAELAQFLVEQNILTRFQADLALQDRAWELSLPSFVLTDVLGKGSLGTTYKARAIDREGHFAVKIVPRRNTVILPTVAEKVTAFKEIRHPRVSALVHLGAQGERVYLAWPLLEGGEKLSDIVRNNGKLSPRQAIQVGLQIATGLQAYHEHGLFHGLLKASDVVIGADKRIRIFDFGVGFLLTSDRGKSLLDTMTNSRALASGVECASPESLLDPLDRTVLGDQYSLGCILYYCLAGQYPFPDENPVKKMMAHQFEEPQPVKELNPETPLKLAAILHRMMRKKPEDRYPSMDAVVQALQALTAPAKPVVVPPPPGLKPPTEPMSPSSKLEGSKSAQGIGLKPRSAQGTTARPPSTPGSAPGTALRPRSAQGTALRTAEALAPVAKVVSKEPDGAAGFWTSNRLLVLGLVGGCVLGLLAWLVT